MQERLQCTLVPTSDYRTHHNWLIFGTDDEREEIEQAGRDFDRYFRPRSDMRTVSGGAELREIQSFLRDTLKVVHWNPPSDNAGVERILREAVADGRLVPVLNRGYGYSCRTSRPTPAPLRWPSSGGGGMVRATSYGSSWASSSSALLNGEPILSGPYDPATQAARLSAARGAIAASANGLGPADNSIFHDNGDVEFNGRIFEDSIHDYAP